MEEIFGSLVPVIIIISFIVRFISKNMDKKDEDETLEDRIKKAFLTDGMDGKGEDDDEEWVPAYEEEKKPLQKEGLTKDNNLEKTDLAVRYKQNKDENSIELDDEITVRDGEVVRNVNGIKRKSANIKMKDKDPENKQKDSSFSRKELIKGVIFKEILDAPRARRPYHPLNWKN